MGPRVDAVEKVYSEQESARAARTKRESTNDLHLIAARPTDANTDAAVDAGRPDREAVLPGRGRSWMGLRRELRELLRVVVLHLQLLC